ncbi:MAG TPA: flagellar export protein FliJ [Solirubrobacteraceae bacterium]|nr:flagellar export protein FliJ [Solirubrobacteraceae bacterium]
MAPSFRFRLERVRAVRERKEKLAQLELARSITRLSDSQAGVRSAEAEVESARAEQRTVRAEGTVGAAELLAGQAFLERVEAEHRRQRDELARSEAEVADRNQQLATAASEHEALVRLRERRRGEHNRELARRETIFHDELASLRFHRSTA